MRGKLALGGTSLLVALLAAELFLRLFHPCPWYGYKLGR